MTWAGLIYHGGAWWVTSVRGDSEGEVLTGLGELAPDYTRDRLMAISWTEQREATYREGLARGQYTVIRLHPPPVAGQDADT
jgi:hypothetical protein